MDLNNVVLANYTFSAIENPPNYEDNDINLNLFTQRDNEQINCSQEFNCIKNEIITRSYIQISDCDLANEEQIQNEDLFNVQGKRSSYEESNSSSFLFSEFSDNSGNSGNSRNSGNSENSENFQSSIEEFEASFNSCIHSDQMKLKYRTTWNETNENDYRKKRDDKLQKKEKIRQTKQIKQISQMKQMKQIDKESEFQKEKVYEKKDEDYFYIQKNEDGTEIKKEKENMKEKGKEKEGMLKNSNISSKAKKADYEAKIEKIEKISNISYISRLEEYEYEEPKEGLHTPIFTAMLVHLKEAAYIPSSIRENNSTYHPESSKTTKSEQDKDKDKPKASEMNTNTFDIKRNNLQSCKNINSSFSKGESTLSFIALSGNISSTLHSDLNLILPQKSEIPYELETDEFKSRRNSCRNLENEIISEDSMMDVPDLYGNTNEILGTNKNVNVKIPEENPKLLQPRFSNSKKCILHHLIEQIVVHFEWEKTFQNKNNFQNFRNSLDSQNSLNSKNSKNSSSKFKTHKFLIHNFLDINPAFWKLIESNPRFTFSKSNYYFISQYSKYYIWMKCILEIHSNLFDHLEAKEFFEFQNSVPSKLIKIIISQADFINSIIKRSTLNSFNQFLINVDLVFAYPIDREVFKQLSCVDKKKFLNKKFCEEGLDKFRKSITKNNFVNKVYLSLMNEIIVRSIYPQPKRVLSIDDKIQLPIDWQIAKNIADSI